MPPENTKTVQEFYVYSSEFLALAAGVTATNNISVQADSDFVVQKLAYFADIAAAVQTDSSRVIPLATVLITDTGSSRRVMDIAVPINSIFGIGGLPFILPAPRIFRANSTIQVTVNNFSAATAYNIRLAFIGHKTYGLR